MKKHRHRYDRCIYCMSLTCKGHDFDNEGILFNGKECACGKKKV